MPPQEFHLSNSKTTFQVHAKCPVHLPRQFSVKKIPILITHFIKAYKRVLVNHAPAQWYASRPDHEPPTADTDNHWT
jgi:hypothetical protein